MSDSENRSQDLTNLEDALRSLVPQASSLNRDQLLFLAGQASASNQRRMLAGRWGWPLSIAASWLIAVALGLFVGRQSASRVAEQIVYVPESAHAQIVESQSLDARDAAPSRPAEPSYFALRNRMLAGGLDALPASPEVDSDSLADPPYLEMRNLMLEPKHNL